MIKRILDSVHGNIFIEAKYFENIIDTDLFQRLRRVEQSSIRSIFPSARHDRFAHSIGVFHLGSLIDRQIKKDIKNFHRGKWLNLDPDDNKSRQLYEAIRRSYLVACLLHDIAHAPFSHTFEDCYGDKETLSDRLAKELNDEFKNDLFKEEIKEFGEDKVLIKKIDDVNYHEYASAIVALTKFDKAIKRLHANKELVARMITGVKYTTCTSRYNQVANGFITLLHGDIIDADRLDYACRDVWASGYATSTIDVIRLISGIHFRWDNKNQSYEICFDSNVLNEIEGVIAVKDFQMQHVIHHHTVEYEQELLKQAARQMANHLFPQEENGEKALAKIISVDNITGGMSIPLCRKLNIKHIADDDLIFLIKNDIHNDYYGEWASRKYKKFALWKTRTEFFSYFADYFHWEQDITPDFLRPIFESIVSKYNYDKSKDLQIIKVKYKDKVKMDGLYVYIGNKIMKYSELFKYEFHGTSSANESKQNPFETIFCYVYLTKNATCKYKSSSFEKEKENIIRDLKDAFMLIRKSYSQQETSLESQPVEQLHEK